MSGKRKLFLGLVAILATGLLLVAGNTLRNAQRLQPFDRNPQALQVLLSANWRMLRPEGAGPYPLAILLSGCDGVRDNMDYWAQVMAQTGRAALILDSHGPRNLARHERWRAVCAAQVLTGAERAGDLAVALAAIEQMDDIDAADVVVMGASHGGWTVMEFMQLATQGTTPPPGLTDWPAPPGKLLEKIGKVILLYPYCGLISGAASANWPRNVRGLMILADQDQIVNQTLCQRMAFELREQGAELQVQVIANADHGFDQKERSSLSPLEFNQTYTDIAKAAVRRLLDVAP